MELGLTGPYRATTACLAATCALLPAYVVRWHLAFYPTTLLEAAVLVTAAVFLVESWNLRRWPSWRSPFLVPAALFLLAGLISVVDAPSVRAAAGLYRAYVVEPLALFVITTNVVDRLWRARLLLAGLGLGGLAVGLANFVVVVDAGLHHTLNVAVAPPVVIYNTLNAVALFLLPLVSVAGAVILHGEERWERVAAAIFVLVALVSIVASFSRGGYLALTVVALLLALSHPARRWLVPALVLAGLALLLIPPVRGRLSHEIDLADPNNSLEERIRLWKATLRMLGDHPILGTGMSGFSARMAPYGGDQGVIYPHDILLNFWTETGLLGIVAFAWIILAGLRTAWRGWRSSRGAWRAYQLGVGLALVAVLVHGLVDVPYWKNDLSAEFWILLGVSWSGARAF